MGSVGKTLGRVGTGILTGGLSEVARGVGGSGVNKVLDFADSAYLPIAGTIAGGTLLGPMGAGLGNQLGGLFSGGSGMLGNLMGGGGMNAALGGSLLGLGLSKDTSIPGINVSGAGQVRPMIDQEMQRQRDLFNQQGSMLSDLLNRQRQTTLEQLTTGKQGEDLRREYNRLGMLNSGAFEEALANRFSDQQKAAEEAIMAQRLGETNVLSGLSSGGLGREFGLQDIQTQVDMARAIQEAQQKAQLQQALIGTGGQLLGGGMASNGGGGVPGGGGLAGLLGGFGGALSNVYNKFFGGGGGSSGMPSSLSLIPGGSPSAYYSNPLAYSNPIRTTQPFSYANPLSLY